MANFNKAALAITIDNSTEFGTIKWKCKIQVKDGEDFQEFSLTDDQFLNILDKIKQTVIQLKEKTF